MFVVQTSLGPVPVWGRLGDGPMLFVIRGVTPFRDLFLPLAQRFPSVVLVHLPGLHSPFFARNSVQDFAGAFDEVIERLGGPAVVVGLSMGGVVALAMKRATRLLLLDPTLRTPLPGTEGVFSGLAGQSPEAASWLSDLLGFTPGGWAERNYSALSQDLRIPGHTLVASRGYCNPTDVRHPLMRVTTVEGGHVLSKDNPDAVMDAIEEALADAVEAQRAGVQAVNRVE